MTTKLEPSPLFTDGAVLCRDREIRIFGEAADGAEARAVLTDRNNRILAENGTTAKNGRFIISLPPQTAQTGCRLVIHCEEEQTEAEDIAIGDVYLAGGQSNMEMELRNSAGGTEQVPDDPLLRFFNVPRMARVNREQQQAVQNTRWQSVTRETAGFNSAAASIFGAEMRRKHPEIPVGIIGCYWGGTSVTCWIEEETLRTTAEGSRYLDEYAVQCGGITMEAWLEKDRVFWETLHAWEQAVADCQQANPGAPWKEIEAVCGPAPWNPPPGPGSPFRPAGLAVTMVREVVPVTLTGILYYQGEQDADATNQYDVLMELLIRSWRELFREETLPFLFVQLPMWLNWDAEDLRSWAKLRLAQAKARDEMPGTGMICLLDQGEYGNIHPTAKRPVGERLAELAGAMIYGGGEISPRALGKQAEGNTLAVCLSVPVRTADGGDANLLEIAGEDRQFVPAKAEIRGDTLVLGAESVSRPVYARYAWTDYSDQVNLFGENGLPLEPFNL